METVPLELKMGIEELALALSLMGRPEAAKGLLFASFGQMAAAEEQGRLLAAGHSLMARGLLSVQAGQSCLAEDLRELLQVLIGNDFAIQFNRRSGTSEETLAYFVRGSKIVRQELQQGVICTLSSVSSRDRIIRGGLDLFGIAKGPGSNYPDAKVPATVLDRAKVAAAEAPDQVAMLLRGAGIPEPLSGLLMEDLQTMNYRGGAMRIESKEGQFSSEQGFLLLRGAQRTWIFALVKEGEEGYARVLAGTADNFARQVQQLMA